VGVNVAVAVGVGVDVEVTVGVCVGVADAVGVGVEFGWSGCVGLEEDMTIVLGVGISDWESEGVAVGVGVSVGGIYGVAVGASATACHAGVGVSDAGAAGLVHASTADVAANRATIDPAMATVIGFLLEAILGCLCRGFMTRKCYTARERDDGGCHDNITVGGRDCTGSSRCHGRTAVCAVNCLGRLSLPLRRRGW